MRRRGAWQPPRNQRARARRGRARAVSIPIGVSCSSFDYPLLLWTDWSLIACVFTLSRSALRRSRSLQEVERALDHGLEVRAALIDARDDAKALVDGDEVVREPFDVSAPRELALLRCAFETHPKRREEKSV